MRHDFKADREPGTGASLATEASSIEVDDVAHKEAEHMLQLSEERLRDALKNTSITLYRQDRDLRYTWIHNPLTIFTTESIVGKTDADLMLPEEAERLTGLKRRVLATGESRQEEMCVTNEVGIRIAELTIEPVRGANGIIVGVTGAVIDITERKRVEEERTKRLARARKLEVLFEAMTDAVVVYDASGHIVQVNTAANEQLIRYIRPEFMNFSVYERAQLAKPQGAEGELMEPNRVPVIRILNGETIPGSEAQDVRVHTFTGEDLWLNITGTPLRDDAGKIMGAITIARDVTERRLQELRTRQALEALMEMAQVVVQGTKQELKDLSEPTEPAETVTPLRRSMQRLAQLTLEVLGCHRLGFTHVEQGTELLSPLAVAGLPPEQEQQWWREQEGQQVHLTDGGDMVLIERLRSNEILLLDMSQPPYNEQPNPYGIKQMLTAPMILGSRLLGLLTLDYGGLDHTYSGEEMALTRAVTKLAALAIERDQLLTEAAQARVNELAAQEAAHLKDEFIGIASHELRTPMTTMKANLQLAQRQLRRFMQQEPVTKQALGQLPHFLERTEQQLERQQRLVQDLLDSSRIEMGHLELYQAPCDLMKMVRETIEDQRQVTPNRIMQLRLPESDTVMVLADIDRVSQVVSNYLSNALKYSDADKAVEVDLEVINEEARISVRDQGPGLSEKQQQRIWERFYRVPDVHIRTGSGVGLGLGLHISRTLIEKQGGTVGVESEQGKGSTFWFVLPLVTSENGKATRFDTKD